MLKFNILILLTIFTFQKYIYCQNIWVKTIPYQGEAPFGCIAETYDKGMIFITSPFGVQHPFLVKTDVNGNIIYKRFLKFENPIGNKNSFCSVTNLVSSKDGSIFICGGLSFSDTINSGFVAKLNKCGDLEWNYLFNDSINFIDGEYTNNIRIIESDKFLVKSTIANFNIFFNFNNLGSITNIFSIKPSTLNKSFFICNNSDIIFTGDIYLNDSNINKQTLFIRTLLTRVNPLKGIKWYRSYALHIDSLSFGNNLLENDLFIYILGNHNPKNWSSLKYLYLKKCDSLGNEIWHRSINTIDTTILTRFFHEPIELFTIDNNKLIIVENYQFGKFYHYNQMRLLKLDLEGQILDTFFLGDSTNNFIASASTKTYDSNFIVLGYNYSNPQNSGYTQLRKYDSNLKPVLQTNIQLTYDSLCPHAVRTDDIDLSNPTIITLKLDSENIHTEPHYNVAILKPEQPKEGIKPIIVWPNPFNEILNLDLPNYHHIKLAEIYRMDGRLIWTGNISNANQIHTQNISEGSYILNVYDTSGQKWSTKIIKTR